MRKIVWYSCGAASAVALKLAATSPDVGEFEFIAANCDLSEDEHPDNARFTREVEDWTGVKILRLKSTQYASVFDVFRKRRYIVGPTGAPCTKFLKKKVREDFQRPDDLHVFGFTADEKQRAEYFESDWPDVDCDWNLIREGVTKADCYGLLKQAGIALPAMYLLGYHNNNCIGCVKGGMGYWNKIRRDFPERFWKMARLEREIGATVIRRQVPGQKKKVSVYLDELDPEAGRFESLDLGDCGVICESRKVNLTVGLT